MNYYMPNMGIPGKNTKNVVQGKKLEVSSYTESKVMTKYISLDKLGNLFPNFHRKANLFPDMVLANIWKNTQA